MKTGKQILKLLEDTCHKENMTVIIVTHNTAIADMADKVIKFKNGSYGKILRKKKHFFKNLNNLIITKESICVE